MPELTDLNVCWEKTEMSSEDFTAFFKCFPNLVNLSLKLKGLTGFKEDDFIRFIESYFYMTMLNS
jgi:hypothetical protein